MNRLNLLLNDRPTYEELKLFFDIKIRELASTYALQGDERVMSMPTTNATLDFIWRELEVEYGPKEERKQINEAR